MKPAACSCRVSTSFIFERRSDSRTSRFSSPGIAKTHSTPSFSRAATSRSEPFVTLTGLAGHRLTSLRPARQLPVRPNEVTGVTIRITFQIILMLWLGLPERSGGRHLGDNLTRPKAGCIDIGDGVFRDPLLLVVGIEDGRPVARSPVVTLTVQRARIVDLEKEFQQLSIADDLRIKGNFNGFRMIAVIAIGRVRHLAAGVAHPGGNHAGIAAQQILHTPEAAAGKDCPFCRNCHVIHLSSPCGRRSPSLPEGGTMRPDDAELSMTM